MTDWPNRLARAQRELHGVIGEDGAIVENGAIGAKDLAFADQATYRDTGKNVPAEIAARCVAAQERVFALRSEIALCREQIGCDAERRVPTQLTYIDRQIFDASTPEGAAEVARIRAELDRAAAANEPQPVKLASSNATDGDAA